MLLMAVFLVRSWCFIDLAGCKVGCDCLQYHHHHWRQLNRRQHDQHAVHPLFQSNFILRIPATSRSPRQALPSSSGWDGLPLEDFRWLQLNTTTLGQWGQLSQQSHSLSPFFSHTPPPLPPSRWSARIFFHRLIAPTRFPLCATDHLGLEVDMTLSI